ncbi:hypothetical protein AVEN_6307-1 [Araneus ventricosus]|uniref:Uncharacterized protein n=1 Tax=Araneus ventricosus TaxID=182803 RepID=A0A4Y2TEY5_ARAVE|nr:hypothetical protein AVEN_6307-1 [Araneus ventricosus]
MVAEAVWQSVHQFMELGMEEIKVQAAEPFNDGFLDFAIGSEIATCEVLLQYSEEMEITLCEIQAVGRAFQCLYCLIVLHICLVTPDDSHLFGLFKKHLAGRYFRTDVEIQEAVVK